MSKIIVSNNYNSKWICTRSLCSLKGPKARIAPSPKAWNNVNLCPSRLMSTYRSAYNEETHVQFFSQTSDGKEILPSEKSKQAKKAPNEVKGPNDGGSRISRNSRHNGSDLDTYTGKGPQHNEATN